MEVVQKTTTTADHREKATTGSEVFYGIFKVGGEVIDAFCEKSDLDVGRAGVLFVEPIPCDDLAFCLPSHKKKTLCEKVFESMLDAGLSFVGGWGWGDCGLWRFRYAMGRRKRWACRR